MIKIANSQMWVHDQDEALAFYTEKLGWEVRADVTMPEMGDFRWLTVGPSDQPDFSVVLMAVPGQPVLDEETRKQVKARGVEFSEEPEERPYGIDAGFHDPSGNSFRLTQVTAPELSNA
jgi:predicted enzyme related to lactoylglutathione lyase